MPLVNFSGMYPPMGGRRSRRGRGFMGSPRSRHEALVQEARARANMWDGRERNYSHNPCVELEYTKETTILKDNITKYYRKKIDVCVERSLSSSDLMSVYLSLIHERNYYLDNPECFDTNKLSSSYLKALKIFSKIQE